MFGYTLFGIAVSSAYRWIQAAESMATLELDKYPELLEVADIADLFQVSMPVSVRRRVESRVKIYHQAAREVAEANRALEKETARLAKVETEARDAAEAFNTAKTKAGEKLKPLESEVEGTAGKVSDAKERVSEAKGKVQTILAAARAKVVEAKANVIAQGQKVAQAVSRQAAAAAEKNEAKDNVASEVAKAKGAKAKGADTARDAQNARDWDAVRKAILNATISKALTMFSDKAKAAEAIRLLANDLLAAAMQVDKGQTMKAA